MAVWTCFLAALGCCRPACAQEVGDSYVVLPYQEVRVAHLPFTTADSTSDFAVLQASVAAAVLDRDICCGRNSALEDPVTSARGASLKEVGEKLRGKHYLAGGSPIVVTDRYWPAAAVTPEEILGALLGQHPLLMDWNGHLYVVYGVVFDEYRYASGARVHAIRDLLLADTRFSDRRRYLAFDRQKDDWSKVTGLLELDVSR